ncbi:MAG TPA: PQQ-binding-like beta-propeller repeat protein [Ktedonosporobacter sp.]|nr:PQQ-binding-like beta-propeller repeat protein [Ktedonosporobacter sp.]
MHQQPTNTGSAKKRLYLSALAAALVGSLLLGGYLWLMNTKPSQPHPTSTPVVAPSPPENVYMARNNHVVKLDGRTGAIIWQQTLKPPGVNSPATCLQIVDGMVYAILDYDSYAFRTSDGKQLWHISLPSTHSKNLSCQVVGDRIYVLHRDGTYSALDAKNGAEIWRSAVVLTDSMIFQVLHGAIYSEQNVGSTPRLSALDTLTGKERWHADLQEGNSMSPTLVADGIVYHTTSNIIYALDEATGQILWQQHTDEQGISFDLASIANGVLYADTSTYDLLMGCRGEPPPLVCQDNTYHVYAFDARKGTLLWKSNPGLHLYYNNYSDDASQPDQPSLPVVNGTVLAYQLHKTTNTFNPRDLSLTLYALDARDGAIRWQVNLKCDDNNCGMLPATLDGNKITLIESNSQRNTIHVLTIDLSSGRPLAEHTVPFQNQGRPVEFVSMDNDRIYLLAKGNEYTLDVIHGLNLADGADLWHYKVDDYASGSIEMPIVAP